MKINIVYLVGVLFLFSACYKNSLEQLSQPGGCDTSNITYGKDIRPLIGISCSISGCHNAGAVETFPLIIYADIKAKVDDGLLLKSIKHEAGVSAMPKNVSKLTDCNINKITVWINNGALNN